MRAAVILLAVLVVPACSRKGDPGIKVQHVLIGFKDAQGFRDRGGAPAKAASRTRDEAEALANDVLARAKAGEDFAALVSAHSDDGAPGIYELVDAGKKPGEGAYRRGDMAKGFGDLAFSLAPADIGIVAYSKVTSPYGWHIIKRLE
jgi:parvulin-like peptidyl-prolyl isomerase